ncbi:MAG: DUF2721 domain-containing protein [Burkholderiaceae bacterium]|nr:DUF2721 domain-containing protein [Burkholderiaceae bacterium]
MESHVTSVTHVIQLAVAPVFLLTAIATLINAMNLRLNRIIDRQRTVQAMELADAPREALQAREREIALLDRRVHLSYRAIVSAVIAGLLVCLVVALAFIGVLLEVDLARVLAVLFVLAMFSMITALSVFLREITVAVSARQRPRAVPQS